MSYDQGYADGRDGKPQDRDREGDREYVTGFDVGYEDRLEVNIGSRMSYEQGFQDGDAGKDYDDEYTSDREYFGGFEDGKAARAESMDKNFVRRTAGAFRPPPGVDDVSAAIQEYLDGYRGAKAGDEFQLSLLESESYRAGFRDGERMIGVSA